VLPMERCFYRDCGVSCKFYTWPYLHSGRNFVVERPCYLCVPFLFPKLLFCIFILLKCICKVTLFDWTYKAPLLGQWIQNIDVFFFVGNLCLNFDSIDEMNILCQK